MVRLSITLSIAPRAVDRSRPGSRGGTARDAGSPATPHARCHARGARAGHTPNSPARIGRPAAIAAAGPADSPARPAPAASQLSSPSFRRARQPFRQPPHVLHQLREWPRRRPRPGDNHQLDVFRDQAPDLAVRFPDPAPRPIALHGPAQLAAHRKPHPPPLGAAPERDEGRPLYPVCLLENRLKIGRPPEALTTRQREPRRGSWQCVGSDREALASLCAPPLQHLPPALRLHPGAEAVRLLPPAHIGLERPLHWRSSPLVEEPT